MFNQDLYLEEANTADLERERAAAFHRPLDSIAHLSEIQIVNDHESDVSIQNLGVNDWPQKLEDMSLSMATFKTLKE